MIHVICCGYKCGDTMVHAIKSLQSQTYKEFRPIVTVWDGAHREYLLKTTITAIEKAKPDPEDIVACVDLDDFLCDETAFEIVAKAYADNPRLLLTYGSYVNLSSKKPGKFCRSYENGEDFRTTDWRGSHLKTFKYKLLKQVPPAEFLDSDGEMYRCCADRAMMIPMMEIAGHDRIMHIPTVLYCYNDLNPISVWNTMKEDSKRIRERISTRPPLHRIEQI